MQNAKCNLKCKITSYHDMPLRKWSIRKLALLHQWFFSGLKVTDNHCGLRALSRKAGQKIKITQDRMSHASEILDQIARHKLRYQEIYVAIKDTKYSLQKSQKGVTGSLKILYDFFVGRILN
jgi:xanthine dehydrogenase molybdopterin-binding subunit B